MAQRRVLWAAGCVLGLGATADAQPIGTFRWQLQPFCNVVTVAVTQNGAIYRLEGTDDQCGGGADAASVTGTAFPNPDGTIGFGLTVVTAPGGRPLHVDAEITVGTFSGTWRDSAGATGSFVLTPGAGNGGSPRPLPAPAVPATIQLRPDGGVVAAGSFGQGVIPASGPGARMMWHPGKAAFRAGQALGSEWDDPNIGTNSAAIGFETRATGDSDIALGYNTLASGGGSIAMGVGTVASANGSTAMGANTTASGFRSTAMGDGSTASGFADTALGNDTTASGGSSLAGGFRSLATGLRSLAFGNEAEASNTGSVAVGDQVTAAGRNSVVLGSSATALTTARGSFVFGDDSTSTPVTATAVHQFVVRAAGGVYFNSNPQLTTGVQLNPNSSQWLSLSDVRTKHRFRELDGDDVLARIALMPVTEWSYKAQDDAIRHIGPTAQDFHAAFGLGEDPLRIGTLDADGVALAAVKALEARTHDHSDSIDQQRERIANLEAEVARLRALVLALTGSPR